jgi:uncharacterized membrane protein
MADAPIELIVAAFQDEQGAENALTELKNAKREQLIAIKDAAVIRRDVNNKVHIKDVRDVGGGKGAVAGAIFGTAIALLTGPVGIVIGGAAGALVGGLTAKAVDTGLPNKRLKELAEALKPGTSAIVAIIEHTWVTDIEQMMADAGAQVMRDAIKADISEQLEAGRNVSYTALSTDESMSMSRMAGDDDSVEISGLTLSDDGLAASATVMTKEGAVSHGLVLTEDGMVTGTAVALPEDAEEEEKPDTAADEDAPKAA